MYADALIEHGDPEMAEYIKEQIAHPSRTESCWGDYSVGQFCTTEYPCPVCDDLHDKGIPWALLGEDRYKIRRGFVASIICTAADWLRHADDITAAAPIEEVTLTDARVGWIDRGPGFNGWYVDWCAAALAWAKEP